MQIGLAKPDPIDELARQGHEMIAHRMCLQTQGASPIGEHCHGLRAERDTLGEFSIANACHTCALAIRARVENFRSDAGNFQNHLAYQASVE